jgi:hypothetical protein
MDFAEQVELLSFVLTYFVVLKCFPIEFSGAMSLFFLLTDFIYFLADCGDGW